MTMSICLTEKEVQEITNRVHRRAQILALIEMNIPCKVRPDGTPMVLWKDIDSGRLDKGAEPDFSQIHAKTA